MKLLSLMTLCLVGTSAFAQTNPRSLFNYTVYAKDSLIGECSDVQGKTAAGGSVYFRDYMVRSQAGSSGCALESATDVQFYRGKVLSGSALSCIAAPSVRKIDAPANVSYHPLAPFNALNAEMDYLSNFLSTATNDRRIKQMYLSFANLSNGQAAVTGSANELVVVNVLERDVTIYGMDIILSGGVTPRNLIWNFPNANSVFIAFSGGKGYGFPGTVVAPNAQVTFNNSLITGALFARSIVGKADNASCSGVVGGQVNGACLNGTIAGIGCGVLPPPPAPTCPCNCPKPPHPHSVPVPVPPAPIPTPYPTPYPPAPLPPTPVPVPPTPMPVPDQHQHQHQHQGLYHP